MTRVRALVTALVALLLAAVAATVAGSAGTGGRQPLANVELAGFFSEAGWPGNVSIKIAPGEPRLYRISGILPGTCHDKRKGRTVRVGADGAIGMQFDALPNAVIHPDGTFGLHGKGVGRERSHAAHDHRTRHVLREQRARPRARSEHDVEVRPAVELLRQPAVLGEADRPGLR